VLINKAAALIESKGKAAFPELRKKDTEWFSGDTYLFGYDLKSNVLLNAAFPEREGTNTTGQKDAIASYFITTLFRWLNPRDQDGSTACSRNQGKPNRRRNGPT
jgi:cytochrome c